ncbi:dual specificity protein phosphatase 10 isoform X1 [Electrophorus electricus]|uniref:Dual specificity protein phosphatase 10 n=1 Tax=Electrophorus electricus TaxID=8005 RepID=A0A4W4H6E3_ELEEL|nr:dual specificity protein phosphatase 10 isoform X1 [Electrophorus electricus]
MPPSPLDDRIVVALSRPIRPQELHLHLDTSYLEATVGTVSKSVISSTTVVKIQANNLTYMPSSSGSTRSLTCGCSSASCCTVTTYEKDNQTQAPTLSQVSTSSPNLNSGVGFGGHGSIPLPTASPSETHSAPSLTVGLPRSGVRVILPNELAQKMTHCPMGHPVGPVPVIIDCRPFLDYNKSHITGAVHINCSDKISRRRLQQGKITVLDLISCRQSKESFKGIFSKEIVVYDEGTVDPGRLSPSQPLHVVLESLQREGKDPIVLRGGLSSFKQGHEELCEHSLHLQDGQDAGAAVSLAGALPHSLPSTPDIENAELTTVLPFLYLGNERDAQDLDQMQRMNIGYILNVTTHLPLYHYDLGLFSYKRLPATDSNKQNLRQYFEEAFEFIEEAHQAGKGLLIHCQAGVSRSATIVIAYLMKHTWMTMTDAYKFVKMRRPIISPNLNFMGQLLEFEEDLNNGITPRILTPKLIGVETIV